MIYLLEAEGQRIEFSGMVRLQVIMFQNSLNNGDEATVYDGRNNLIFKATRQAGNDPYTAIFPFGYPAYDGLIAETLTTGYITIWTIGT